MIWHRCVILFPRMILFVGWYQSSVLCLSNKKCSAQIHWRLRLRLKGNYLTILQISGGQRDWELSSQSVRLDLAGWRVTRYKQFVKYSSQSRAEQSWYERGNWALSPSVRLYLSQSLIFPHCSLRDRGELPSTFSPLTTNWQTKTKQIFNSINILPCKPAYLQWQEEDYVLM